MATTYEAIATVTVGSGGASEIDFQNIPSTYTDLLLVASLRDNSANVYSLTYVKFNNVTTNLTSRGLEGNGASASSYSNTGIYISSGNGGGSTSNTFSNQMVYITNYASTTQAKSVSVDGVSENNATTAYASLQAGLWNDTSAINRVTIYNATFVQHSSATLYGIKNS